ncbi:hypothetical protein NL108_010997, partial [Boleophthalmus pectinirostris]
HIIGVVPSSIVSYSLVDGLEQLSDLVLVVSVFIFTVLPVFIINDMAATSTFLHQVIQGLVQTHPLLNPHPLWEVISSSEHHCGVLQSLFSEILEYHFYNSYLKYCVLLYLQHKQEGVGSRGTLCDAFHKLRAQTGVFWVCVKKTWSVHELDIMSTDIPGF